MRVKVVPVFQYTNTAFSQTSAPVPQDQITTAILCNHSFSGGRHGSFAEKIISLITTQNRLTKAMLLRTILKKIQNVKKMLLEVLFLAQGRIWNTSARSKTLFWSGICWRLLRTGGRKSYPDALNELDNSTTGTKRPNRCVTFSQILGKSETRKNVLWATSDLIHFKC